jgi:hypothetical protein
MLEGMAVLKRKSPKSRTAGWPAVKKICNSKFDRYSQLPIQMLYQVTLPLVINLLVSKK